MAREIEPTDPDREQGLGRIALWLDPDDLRWLSTHCDCPPDASEEQKERGAGAFGFVRGRHCTRLA